MLPPFIIEKLREREVESERRKQQVLELELELPLRQPDADRDDEVPPETPERGVVEIPLWVG